MNFNVIELIIFFLMCMKMKGHVLWEERVGLKLKALINDVAIFLFHT